MKRWTYGDNMAIHDDMSIVLDICSKYRVSRRSIYQCVSIVNRYVHSIDRGTVEDTLLLYITSMYMSIKLEEVEYPCLRVYLIGTKYKIDDIVSKELDILTSLDYSLYAPNIMSFFDIISIDVHLPSIAYSFAQYASHILSYVFNISVFTPSEVAGGLLYLCTKIYNRQSWSTLMHRRTSYSKHRVVEASLYIVRMLYSYWMHHRHTVLYRTIESQYSSDTYHCVSSYRVILHQV